MVAKLTIFWETMQGFRTFLIDIGQKNRASANRIDFC